MSTPIIETVLFRLKPGVTRAQFEATLPGSLAFMQSCEGWQSRRLSSSDEGQWIEHVQWASMADAEAAAATIMDSELAKPFISLIQGSSIQMHHSELVMAEDATGSK